MYAVIFRATVAALDKDYVAAIEEMKQLAFEDYGCLEFVSMTEGDERVAISYWESPEAIANWKRNMDHLAAQARGREKWYQSYTVQVAKIQREYHHNR